MLWFSFLLIFSLGLCVGSFINVLIYRSIHGMSPYKGRSICDHCKRQLSWYENIPLVSYLVLRGKCRTCKKKIPWSYPLVEFVTGLLFVWWAGLGFAFFRLTQAPLTYIQPSYWLLIGVILIFIFFTDLFHGIIPDSAVIVMTIAGLGYRLYLNSQGIMQTQDLINALLSGVVAFSMFLMLFLATKGRGIGFGDVKFAFPMAVVLGFPKALVGFFMSFMIGGAIGSVLLLLGKKRFGQTVPFGPFLVAGFVVALLWGDVLWQWYMLRLT